MRRTILALLLTLGACLPSAAQTFQQAIAPRGAGTVNSPELFNQGQAQHLIAIQVADDVLTCFPQDTLVTLQGSFDGQVYQNFGETFEVSDTAPSNVTGLFIRRGEGYFPRVRVHAEFAGADCEFTVWYSGTQQTVSPKYEPDPGAGGLQWYCQNAVSMADTEFVIVPPAAGSNLGLIVVHSLFVYSEGVRIFDIGYNLVGPVWVPLMGTLTLPADGHLMMPPAVTPYFTVPGTDVDGLKLKLYTGTTDVTVCVSARYSVEMDN